MRLPQRGDGIMHRLLPAYVGAPLFQGGPRVTPAAGTGGYFDDRGPLDQGLLRPGVIVYGNRNGVVSLNVWLSARRSHRPPLQAWACPSRTPPKMRELP